MNPFILKQVFLLSILLLCKFASAQSNEYIHLHFDKDIYLPGETIWFKAYLYSNNTASTLSTNFFVSTYDSDGRAIEHKQYPIFDGCSFGDFKIADTLQTNSIRVRAYTNASMRFDSNNVFEKRLIIYNENLRKDKRVTLRNDSIQLHFFAEGGNFVAGISNYISFKAFHKSGKPANANIVIVDENGKIVTDTLHTNELGLGTFQITPKEAERFYANWYTKDESISSIPLPEVEKSGVVLHTEMVGNTLHYVVNKNKNSNNIKKMYLLAQMGNEEMYKADLNFKDELQVISRFSIDSFPAGILQITLMDERYVAISQRMIYINPNNDSELQFKTLVKNNKPKTKNSIEIDLGNTKFINLSASIADIGFYDTSIRYNIHQNLLQKSIKNISKILQNELDQNDAQITNLISLTHDWNRMNWQHIMNNQEKVMKPIDNYLTLLVDTKDKKNKIANGELLNLVINDKVSGRNFYNLPLNSNNHFRESGFILYDSTKINIGLKYSKENSQYLNLSVQGLGNFKDSIAPEEEHIFLNQNIEDNKLNSFIDTFKINQNNTFNSEQTIKEVVVKTKYRNPAVKRIIELDEKYTTGMFSGTARGYQLNLLDDEQAWSHSDVFNYLQYRLPSLQICRSFGERFLIFSRNNGGCDIKNALITFVDEVELPEQVGLASLPISQIAYVKFIPGIVAGSSFVSANGALYIYTKKGDEISTQPQQMKSLFVSGYHLPNFFTNPDYSDSSKLLNADKRTTVYWNPYLTADETTNKINIEYYNNDVSKKLLLTIEGINAEGKLIRIVKVIEN